MSFTAEVLFEDKSPVDILLDKEDCSVDDLLDEPSILQECKSQKLRLMELFADTICDFFYCVYVHAFDCFAYCCFCLVLRILYI